MQLQDDNYDRGGLADWDLCGISIRRWTGRRLDVSLVLWRGRDKPSPVGDKLRPRVGTLRPRSETEPGLLSHRELGVRVGSIKPGAEPHGG